MSRRYARVPRLRPARSRIASEAVWNWSRWVAIRRWSVVHLLLAAVDAPEQLAAWPLEHLGLDRVDPVLDGGYGGEEGVGQLVEDPVDEVVLLTLVGRRKLLVQLFEHGSAAWRTVTIQLPET